MMTLRNVLEKLRPVKANDAYRPNVCIINTTYSLGRMFNTSKGFLDMLNDDTLDSEVSKIYTGTNEYDDIIIFIEFKSF